MGRIHVDGPSPHDSCTNRPCVIHTPFTHGSFHVHTYVSRVTCTHVQVSLRGSHLFPRIHTNEHTTLGSVLESRGTRTGLVRPEERPVCLRRRNTTTGTPYDGPHTTTAHTRTCTHTHAHTHILLRKRENLERRKTPNQRYLCEGHRLFSPSLATKSYTPGRPRLSPREVTDGRWHVRDRPRRVSGVPPVGGAAPGD